MGRRISIQNTRALLNAALEGALSGAKFRKDPVFGFELPFECPGAPPDILNPENVWPDKAAYKAKCLELAGLFAKNFAKFGVTNEAVIKAGPKTSQILL